MSSQARFLMIIRKLAVIFARAFVFKAGIGFLRNKLNPAVWIKTHGEWFKYALVSTYFSALFMITKFILSNIEALHSSASTFISAMVSSLALKHFDMGDHILYKMALHVHLVNGIWTRVENAVKDKFDGPEDKEGKRKGPQEGGLSADQVNYLIIVGVYICT